MDAHECIAYCCPTSAAVLAHNEDIEVVPLDALPSEAVRAGWMRRGLAYIGIVGLNREGALGVACDDEDAALMLRAIPAFLDLVRDGGDWLERLYRLEDPRA